LHRVKEGEPGSLKENFSQLRGLKSVNFIEHRAEQEAKFSSFREISDFLRDCEIPRGGGDIPTPL